MVRVQSVDLPLLKRDTMHRVSLGAVTDFITKAATMKTRYIYYGFEDPFNNRDDLQMNLENRLKLSDARETGAEQSIYTPTHGRRASSPNKAAHHDSSKSTQNVRKIFLDFDSMNAKNIETLDFAAFVSS